MQKFFQGKGAWGQIWGTDKRGGGGAEAYVRCYTLHLLGGGGGGGGGPMALPAPLKYSPDNAGTIV